MMSRSYKAGAAPSHLIIFKMDGLGIEPRASRMLSGCDTTTPTALAASQLQMTIHRIATMKPESQRLGVNMFGLTARTAFGSSWRVQQMPL